MLPGDATKHNWSKALELLPENPPEKTNPRRAADFRHGSHRVKQPVFGEVSRAVAVQVSVADYVVDGVERLLTVVLDQILVQG